MMDDFRENFVRNRVNGNGIGAGARGFFNDLQQFQPLNEHGDFAEERARAPATPPSEEAIETLMVRCFCYSMHLTNRWYIVFPP